MTNHQKALLAIFLFSLLSGANPAVSKIGFVQLPPLTFSFLRFLLATIVIIPFHLKAKRVPTRDIIRLIPISLLGTANIFFFVTGLNTTTAIAGQLLYAATPLLTALIIFSLFKDPLNLRKLIGILVGFIGVCIVILQPILERGKPFSGDVKGNILITIAVLFWSFYMVFSKRWQRGHSPFALTLAFIYVTTVSLFPFFLLEQSHQNTLAQLFVPASIIALLYMSIISTVGTYLLNQYAIKHGGSVFASLSLYLAPIFAYLWAAVLLGEQLTVGLVIGGILALLGVFFTTATTPTTAAKPEE